MGDLDGPEVMVAGLVDADGDAYVNRPELACWVLVKSVGVDKPGWTTVRVVRNIGVALEVDSTDLDAVNTAIDDSAALLERILVSHDTYRLDAPLHDRSGFADAMMRTAQLVGQGIPVWLRPQRHPPTD